MTERVLTACWFSTRTRRGNGAPMRSPTTRRRSLPCRRGVYRPERRYGEAVIPQPGFPDRGAPGRGVPAAQRGGTGRPAAQLVLSGGGVPDGGGVRRVLVLVSSAAQARGAGNPPGEARTGFRVPPPGHVAGDRANPQCRCNGRFSRPRGRRAGGDRPERAG